MVKLLGFLTINDFISNADNVINPIGELSLKAETYSTDTHLYTAPGSILHIFNIEDATADELLLIDEVNNIIANRVNGIPTGIVGQGTLAYKINNVLGSGITNLVLGDSILNTADNRLYPAYIEFTYTTGDNIWEYKIWFSYAAFELDYPKGQFELILPLENMQLLYNNYTLAKAQLAALTPTSLIDKAGIQINHVVTGYVSMTFLIYNVQNTTQHCTMPLLVAYNGNMIYNNVAAFTRTLADILIGGGNYTLLQWLVVIPNLVPVNKYYIGVNWDNTSIANLSLETPIGSPTVKISDINAYADKVFNDFTPKIIASHLDYSVAVYKSMGFFVLPAIDNPEGIIPFRVKFHDYFLALVNDVNIDQMSASTQNIVVLLDTLLNIADRYTSGDILPLGVITEVKNGFTYISKRMLDVNICVITRQSYLNV